MSELRIFDEKLELLDRAQIAALQLSKLKAMLKHVYQTNAFYASKWKAAGVDVDKINTLSDFAASVPMVEKKDFVSDQDAHPPFGQRLAHPMSLPGRLDIYTTSGTSGQGVEVHAQTKREIQVMEYLYGFLFRWAGLSEGDHVLMTLPVTMLGGGRIEYMGALAYDLSVYPTGNYDAAQKLQILERFRPKALYGSTSYFGHLAAVSGKEPPCSSVKTLLTGLEGTGFSFLKSLEEKWQAKAADRFGCTQMRGDFMFTDETGVGNDKPGVLYNIDPFVLLEVLDTTTGRPVADGEYGELVVTSLYHFDNPVIRNRLRDGAVFRRGGARGSRRAFSGVEVASISRTDDVKKIKGINVFPQAIDDLLFQLPEVEEYRVVLTSSKDLTDVVTVKIMPKKSNPPEADELFVEQVANSLRKKIGIRINVELVPELPRSEYKARRWSDERIR